jgi:2-oxoglutarate ferredoxin oxidoreductase subunit gamma
MKEVVFAGFGGQGVLTAGLVLAQIALFNDKKATWIPEYGAAMRGGTSNCTVKYDPDEVGSPGQEEPDLVMALNNPSFTKFINIVKPGGYILVNSDLVTVDTDVRDDITVLKIPGNSISNELGSSKALNIVMVGAMIKAMGDFTQEEAIAGMNDMFAKKGKNDFEMQNVKAFEAGYAAV